MGDYPPTETATYAIWVLDEAQKIITEYKRKLKLLREGKLSPQDKKAIRTTVSTLSKILATKKITDIREILELLEPQDAKIIDLDKLRKQRAIERTRKGGGRITTFGGK